ncbi:carbon-nitrogen hydrolase family protein [Anaerosporobacter sp.]|uniref:carbon-nitrogen hydrolase family protein n=1 Tax=Anaerosporobacter sp. TaxID=1872529 RepID=UPI00286EF962|nr:carbon-nitrogen hydrolase family protein [Anaerosporobacter sp.]
MKTKILIAIPIKDNELQELKSFLYSEEADIYVFPEGFLHDTFLEEALKIICESKKFVITGYKEQSLEGTFEKALIIDNGVIIGEYAKCVLTKGEREKGKKGGNKIHCINTKFGKIGIPICYEIHFPEVARIMANESPVLLVNIIGTGMYHETQYEQWTTLAKARAIENEVFVIGCSHYKGEIPLAFAYSPEGKLLLEKKNYYGGVAIEVDLNDSNKKAINYLSDRIPEMLLLT